MVSSGVTGDQAVSILPSSSTRDDDRIKSTVVRPWHPSETTVRSRRGGGIGLRRVFDCRASEAAARSEWGNGSSFCRPSHQTQMRVGMVRRWQADPANIAPNVARWRPHRLALKGTQTRDPTSSSKIVLMDKSAQHVSRSNVCTLSRPWSRIRPWVRRLELKTPVGPSPLVVGDVGPKHPLQEAATEHQHPVQALGPDRAHSPLRERVGSRSPDRGLDDAHAFGAEDLVEGTGVLGVSVSDLEPNPFEPLLKGALIPIA